MQSVELAMKAARARQSPLTGFVHLSKEIPERGAETIPVYENFCFVLALLRTKTAENILEGKALLAKLFAFQTPEGFPVYLHEFPQCKSRKLEGDLSIVSQFLLKEFSSILGETLRLKLASLVKPFEPTPEWSDFLIQSQLTGDDITPALQWWDGKALCYVGPQKQNKHEPALTLFDLIMGQWCGAFSERALVDDPIHLQASLIYPRKVTPLSVTKTWSRRFWGDGKPTHSSFLQTSAPAVEEGDVIWVDLPAQEISDEIEISYYVNRHIGASLSVAKLKSTTFRLGDPIQVRSGNQAFEMIFSCVEGSGNFWGHLHLGNRPGQVGCRGADKHQAFDWRIALRTAYRTGRCRIKIQFYAIEGLLPKTSSHTLQS